MGYGYQGDNRYHVYITNGGKPRNDTPAERLGKTVGKPRCTGPPKVKAGAAGPQPEGDQP